MKTTLKPTEKINLVVVTGICWLFIVFSLTFKNELLNIVGNITEIALLLSPIEMYLIIKGTKLINAGDMDDSFTEVIFGWSIRAIGVLLIFGSIYIRSDYFRIFFRFLLNLRF